MRYIVDVPRWLDTKIKALLASDLSDYAGISEFIVVACENQLKLERVNSSEYLIDTYSKISKNDSIIGEHSINMLNNSTITNTVNMPSSNQMDTTLLWGQVNRIFPVKLGIRVLVNMIKESDDKYVDLDTYGRTAATVARDFGKKVFMLDKQNERITGRKYSTGLPIGKKVDLSKKRYRSHYLAYQTGKGTLLGAMAELRLVNIQDGKIGITKMGLEFAKLDNPHIDSIDTNPPRILSEKEVEFYLKLVDSYLPKEKEFMRTIMQMIKTGEPPRDKFNSNVKEILFGLWDGIVTDAVANTMRSGVLSRLWELGLVDNEKVGRRVVYSINDAGKDYLIKKEVPV